MVSKSPPSSGAAGSGDMRSAEKPLLPEHAGSPGGCSASVLGAVFNVSTSMVGAGIMSIPAPMRVLGVAPAVALIAAVAVLANAAVDFMLRYTRRAADGRRVRPRRGRAAQRVRRVQRLRDPHRLPHHHRGRDVRRGERRGCSRGGAAGVVRAAVVDQPGGDAGGGRGDSAASCAPEAYSLRYTSAISILLAVVFMLISLGIAVYALFRGTATMPRMLPDFSRLSSPLELFTAVPVIVVAFTFHFNVHPIRAELSKTSDMKAAVRISLVLCAAIYAAVGFFSFLLFGDATMADVLANFDRSSGPGVPQVLNDAARFSYALHLVLVFPLLLFSLQVNVDELLFPGRRPLATDARRFVSLTAVLMAVLYALAIAIPSIWTLFEFSGSTFAVTISLIFPGAIVLSSTKQHPVAYGPLVGMCLVCMPLSQEGCSWDSKAEGQSIGGDDDHFGCDYEQHRHCLKHHELHQRRSQRWSCSKQMIVQMNRNAVIVCSQQSEDCCACNYPLF